MLRVSDLSYTYRGAARPALSDVSLEVRGGECLCVTGHSGCGKTTLLLALMGLLHDGELSGDVAIDAPVEQRFRNGAGLVFQNAETQIFCSTVAEEVAFGPENLCVPPDEIGRRVRRALEDVRLGGFWDRNVERLSAGQKHRLAIASVLSMHPRVLLLDEPTSQLDGVGKAELVGVLKELKGQGYALVIAEHNLEPFRDLVDRWAVMANGRIGAITDRAPADLLDPEARGAEHHERGDGARREGAPAIALEGVRLSYPGVGEVLRGVDLSVLPGERVHLLGQNGAGKSSLLACIAGAVPLDSGSIRVAGVEVTERARLFGRVGYLLQNPQRQLFEDTVFEEVAFSLKRLRLPAAEVRRQVDEALRTCEVGELSERLPLSLSFGEQHRVALASVLAPRPEVLLLDEPFSGLDLAQRRRLLDILGRLREEHGTTVVIASHDPLPLRGWPDRAVTVEGGTLA
jgi:energy-coupling factor transport system ATP-binding protein